MEIVKNINPINLELGHIAKDLNVGDKNIVKESNSNIFFSILENFNTKDLQKKNIKKSDKFKCKNLILSKENPILLNKLKKIRYTGECL